MNGQHPMATEDNRFTSTTVLKLPVLVTRPPRQKDLL
jgi:hypothetical protein